MEKVILIPTGKRYISGNESWEKTLPSKIQTTFCNIKYFLCLVSRTIILLQSWNVQEHYKYNVSSKDKIVHLHMEYSQHQIVPHIPDSCFHKRFDWSVDRYQFWYTLEANVENDKSVQLTVSKLMESINLF